MEQLADRLHAAADLLATVDRAVPTLTIPAGAFGADDAGVPGRLGRKLHTHWSAVLTARAQEAADTAARLTDLATALQKTELQYAETDKSVSHRVERNAP
ncbi:MAG TPA: hypothetical protein VGP57_11555 [Actinoplanes sp.]|jgi:hypothetical protein|nr:hypothetical protein [Actinoplanes sp.]